MHAFAKARFHRKPLLDNRRLIFYGNFIQNIGDTINVYDMHHSLQSKTNVYMISKLLQNVHLDPKYKSNGIMGSAFRIKSSLAGLV